MSKEIQIAFVGNCQAEQLADIFSLIYPNVKTLKIPAVHVIEERMKDSILNSLSLCDIICSHNVSESFPINWISTKFLQTKFKDKLFLITNIFSRFLNTQSCYIRQDKKSVNRMQGPLDGIHLSVIVDSYMNGINCEQAAKRYLDYDTFNGGEVLHSIDNLIKRDKDFSVHIPFASSLICLSRIFETMHTFNHPTLSLMYEYAKQISFFLELGPPSLLHLQAFASPKALNNAIHIAPHSCCMEYIGAQYRPSSIFKGYRISKSAETVSIDFSRTHYMLVPELCHYFYELYDAIKLDESPDISVQFY
jgi:hypothetical protein